MRTTITHFFRARRILLALPMAMAANAALAHVGNDFGNHHRLLGFEEGFFHPFSGLDHLLAMLAIGLWAAQNRRQALWVLPLAFPLAMVAGAALALEGWRLPLAEAGIAGSAAVIGLLIAFAVRLPLAAAAALVALFGAFHGYSHGTEMPLNANVGAYGLGFVLATLMLHLTGLTLGWIARGQRGAAVLKLGGLAIAASGMYLLAA
jgi:urease accessory protein